MSALCIGGREEKGCELIRKSQKHAGFITFLVGVRLLFAFDCFLPHTLVVTYLSAAHYLHGFELSVLRRGKMQ